MLLRLLVEIIWLKNYATWSSLYQYIIFTIVVISRLSHTRTEVVVLSTDSSDLIPMRVYICLDRTIIFSLCLVRRSVIVYLGVSLWTVSGSVVIYLAVYLLMVSGWVVVYLKVYLWTVSGCVDVYLEISLWTISRRVVVYLVVLLWMFSQSFPLFSYTELEFLWWQFTMVFEKFVPIVWEFVCYNCGCCCKVMMMMMLCVLGLRIMNACLNYEAV